VTVTVALEPLAIVHLKRSQYGNKQSTVALVRAPGQSKQREDSELVAGKCRLRVLFAHQQIHATLVRSIKEIEVPLFPGYLFCRMNPHNRLPVLMTPGVIRSWGWQNPDSRRGRGDRRHPARGKKRSFDNALAVPGNRPRGSD